MIKSWGYNVLKATQTGKIVDSFIISFGDSEKSEEVVEIGRSIIFAPIVKYLQKMGLPKDCLFRIMIKRRWLKGYVGYWRKSITLMPIGEL